MKHIKIKDDERIIAVLRATPVVLVLPLIISAILIFLPVFLYLPLASFGLVGPVIFWLSIIVGILWTLRYLVMWRLNKTVVTNKRIIDVYQKKPLDVVVSEANFYIVQEVYFRKKGILQHLFDYGTVSVSLQNVGVRLDIRRVRRPALIQAMIVDLRNAVVSRQGQMSDQSDLSDQSDRSLRSDQSD